MTQAAPKKTATKRTTKPAPAADLYKATLIALGLQFHATGATALEAISALTPGKIKGRAILVMEKGEKRKERILQPFVVLRLFHAGGFTRSVWLKNTSLLFNI